ncbi:MAG: hypothetical protein ACOYOQ_16245 [Microthrixaceae bacterium]
MNSEQFGPGPAADRPAAGQAGGSGGRNGLPPLGVLVGVAASAVLVAALAGYAIGRGSAEPEYGTTVTGNSVPLVQPDDGADSDSGSPAAARTDVPLRVYTTAEFPDLGATGSRASDDAELVMDVRNLERATEAPWTPEMLLALGASYCEGWPSEPDQEAYEVSAKGQKQWAASVAPRLGISYDEALFVIRTTIPYRYRVCQ